MMQILLPPEFCKAQRSINLHSFTDFPTATKILSSITLATGSSTISLPLSMFPATLIPQTSMDSLVALSQQARLTTAMFTLIKQINHRKYKNKSKNKPNQINK
jgi:hypothetical protein